MGVKFQITITIDAPIEKVWRKIVDWESQGQWMAMTRVHASHRGADDSAVGTTIDAFTGIAKIGILDRMQVTEWNPPELCVVEHYGRVIKGVGIFRLRSMSDEVAGRTEFFWFEEINGFRPLLLLLKPGIMVAVYFSLRKFARTFARKER